MKSLRTLEGQDSSDLKAEVIPVPMSVPVSVPVAVPVPVPVSVAAVAVVVGNVGVHVVVDG